jgi:hypothetical protein
MEHTRELAIKFWKDAEKSVGEYRDMDIAVKTISETDIKECIRHTKATLTKTTPLMTMLSHRCWKKSMVALRAA